jgi:hypothetical protein
MSWCVCLRNCRVSFQQQCLQAHEEEQVIRDGPHPVGKERLLKYYAHFLHIVSQKPINIEGSASQNNSFATGTGHFTSTGSDGQLSLSSNGDAVATVALKQLETCHLVSQVSVIQHSSSELR